MLQTRRVCSIFFAQIVIHPAKGIFFCGLCPQTLAFLGPNVSNEANSAADSRFLAKEGDAVTIRFTPEAARVLTE